MFQSQFGPEPWLKPRTATVLEELAAQAVRRTATLAPGFVADCLQTLEELGIRGVS